MSTRQKIKPATGRALDGVLLDVGGVCFIARNAVTAAQVVDLLSSMEPCEREWLSRGTALVIGSRTARHDAVIVSGSDVPRFPNRAAFEAAKNAELAKQIAQADEALDKKNGGAK